MAGLIPFDRSKFNMRLNNFEDFYGMLDDFFGDAMQIKKNLFNDSFRLDVKEEGNKYLVEAELPGVKKEEVGIDFRDERLTISVKREENVNKEDEGYIHKERRVSSMQREIYLKDAKAEGAKAELENGILKISIEKIQNASNSYKIDIQ